MAHYTVPDGLGLSWVSISEMFEVVDGVHPVFLFSLNVMLERLQDLSSLKYQVYTLSSTIYLFFNIIFLFFFQIQKYHIL